MLQHLGLRISFLGCTLLLIGLSWDSILHALDVTLAAREGVFTLTNPGHLLLALGIGLVILGVLIEMARIAFAMPARSPVRRYALTSCVLLSLLGATTATVAVAFPEQHGHGEHGGSAVDWTNVTNTELVAATLLFTVKQQGIPAALDQLEVVTAKDTTLRTAGHDLAHAIGRFGFTSANFNPQVVGECRELFQSGCYHGVLEAFFEKYPDASEETVLRLCDSVTGADQPIIIRNECVHGLGHGLTARYNHDILKALKDCDAFPQAMDRGSCYSGTFMENAIFEFNKQNPEHQGVSAIGGHKHNTSHQSFAKKDDPYYPCNIVEDRYKSACWGYQSSLITMTQGIGIVSVLKVCDDAPLRWRDACYQSTGKEISNISQRDTATIVQNCGTGSPQYVGDCFRGAVKHFVDVTWTFDEARVLCRAAPERAKNDCYSGFGERVGALKITTAARASECKMVEAAYARHCLTAATGKKL